MASFNKAILLGNVTRDPEMRYLPSNTAVLDFGIACNRKFKDAQGQDREETMFIDCAAFGKSAEIMNKYVHKGDLLFIEGHLKMESWEDKQGGGKRSKHKVTIDNFQLMPNRSGSPAGSKGDEPASNPASKPTQDDQCPF